MKHELIDNALNTIGQIIGGKATSVEDLRTTLSNLVEYREWAEKLRVGNHDMNAELIALNRVALEPEGEPNEFRLAKARKEEDCRFMTVEDSLLETLRTIRALPKERDTRMAMVWLDFERDKPLGEHNWHTRYANVTKAQAIAYASTMAMEGQLELLGR